MSPSRKSGLARLEDRADAAPGSTRASSPGRRRTIPTARLIAACGRWRRRTPASSSAARRRPSRRSTGCAASPRRAPPRLLVILGASGAGKSSFLRAGLLPRLERDDRNFLPLPIVRPERAALTGETGLDPLPRSGGARRAGSARAAPRSRRRSRRAPRRWPRCLASSPRRRAAPASTARRGRSRRAWCSPSIRARSCSWRRARRKRGAFLDAARATRHRASARNLIVLVHHPLRFLRAAADGAGARRPRASRPSACRRCRAAPIRR